MNLVFEKKSNYQLMVKSCEAFAIPHNGISKEKLAETLNAKVEEVGEADFLHRAKIKIDEAGKISMISEKPVEDVKENVALINVQPTASAKSNTNTSVPNSQPAASSKKWFEGINLPFKSGELVEVIGGILNGRQMEVTRPAPGKVDAMKGHIINQITGGRQNTEVTIDIVNLGTAANQAPRLKNDQSAAVQTPVTSTEEVENTSIEEVSIVTEAPEVPEQLQTDETEVVQA